MHTALETTKLGCIPKLRSQDLTSSSLFPRSAARNRGTTLTKIDVRQALSEPAISLSEDSPFTPFSKFTGALMMPTSGRIVCFLSRRLQSGRLLASDAMAAVAIETWCRCAPVLPQCQLQCQLASSAPHRCFGRSSRRFRMHQKPHRARKPQLNQTSTLL